VQYLNCVFLSIVDLDHYLCGLYGYFTMRSAFFALTPAIAAIPGPASREQFSAAHRVHYQAEYFLPLYPTLLCSYRVRVISSATRAAQVGVCDWSYCSTQQIISLSAARANKFYWLFFRGPTAYGTKGTATCTRSDATSSSSYIYATSDPYMLPVPLIIS
jgi:hypothetical protein